MRNSWIDPIWLYPLKVRMLEYTLQSLLTDLHRGFTTSSATHISTLSSKPE
jgi:hypothetical protein